jgi:hypothetical protein
LRDADITSPATQSLKPPTVTALPRIRTLHPRSEQIFTRNVCCTTRIPKVGGSMAHIYLGLAVSAVALTFLIASLALP